MFVSKEHGGFRAESQTGPLREVRPIVHEELVFESDAARKRAGVGGDTQRVSVHDTKGLLISLSFRRGAKLNSEN